MADERGQTFYHQGAKTPSKPQAARAEDVTANRYARGIMSEMPHALDLLRGAGQGGAPVEATMTDASPARPELLPTSRELQGLYQRYRGQARGVLTPDEESELDRLMDGLGR